MGFSEKLKKKVRGRAHLKCCICEGLPVDVHHIIPESEGGPDTEDNAATLCPTCHRSYGQNPDMRNYIRERRDLWYRICQERYTTPPEVMNKMFNRLLDIPTREELPSLIRKEVRPLIETIVERDDRTPTQKAVEISDLTTSVASIVTCKATEPFHYCKWCGAYIIGLEEVFCQGCDQKSQTRPDVH